MKCIARINHWAKTVITTKATITNHRPLPPPIHPSPPLDIHVWIAFSSFACLWPKPVMRRELKFANALLRLFVDFRFVYLSSSCAMLRSWHTTDCLGSANLLAKPNNHSYPSPPTSSHARKHTHEHTIGLLSLLWSAVSIDWLRLMRFGLCCFWARQNISLRKGNN